ncbi:condensation domain-containing protein [Nocardioides sp. GY 10127]|uniref:condensation domain-containing protein n=1 Tax=Nocardioides sp. GY 10127 TaxID=2569762 RepID=UPI0010A91B9E|nr:condensation domain-containing protein [Nocardioides sp. GY 10127]TIC86462.1 peptide synthetase [Nocardioides sp. GY 10127]
MRLTNVAQMLLPDGRLSSYGVHAGPPGSPLPISFDQRRHVSVGDRVGSWMGISFRLPQHESREALAQAWHHVVERHGTLRTAFSRDEDGGLALHRVEVLPGEWTEHEVSGGQQVRDVLRQVLDAGCRPFTRPSYRLALVEPDDGSIPVVVLAADHSHLDMWSLLVLVRDLLACLDDVRAGVDAPGAGLPKPQDFAEHTTELAERGPAPDEVRARWHRIMEDGGGRMPVFPLPLGRLDPVPSERVEVIDVLDAAQLARLTARAADRGTRMLPLVVSEMAVVTRELADKPLRAVFPVHSRYDDRWHASCGWFITNAVLDCQSPDLDTCAAAVRETVSLGSVALADVLSPWGGMPDTSGMFALSWLDLRRLPVGVDPGPEGQYVSAAIRTDGVMVWFIVEDGGVHLRVRYPDTPEARRSVGAWVDAVVHRLQVYADTEAA